MASTARKRFLIVAFDGLRPDMVTPATMPVLHSFGRDGVRFDRARAVFPTETRVNQATLVTGAWPGRHGIVGNRFCDPVASPNALINSGDEDQLRAADAVLGGRIITAPSLGEILAGHDRSLAVIGSGTAGGTRMLNHTAERTGQFRFSLYQPDVSVPRSRIDAILERFGPIPPAEIPSTDRLTYATDVCLDYVMPEVDADVTILWFFEPDLSSHHRGIGTRECRQALAHADRQLARILEWRERSDLGRGLQIATLSDHGHLSMRGDAIALGDSLRSAGFAAGDRHGDGVDVVSFCGDAGGIYVESSRRETVDAIHAWLTAQSWCGPVFRREADGAFALADVRLDHPRSPDIVFVTRCDDGDNGRGFPGRCFHDATSLPPGGGIHGGLHPHELGCWLAFDGDAFESPSVSNLPSGIIDVMPTMLHVLGLPVPGSVEGRVLEEALAGAPRAASEMPTVSRDARPLGEGDRAYVLETRSLASGHVYLESCLPPHGDRAPAK